ncbi:MAG: phage protease [Flavobacteriaceae bacterium]|nr:phage protease [Flavobacteriaceae bacterium]
MPKPKVFILNDDAVQNSYGFFILTSGGKLDRFKSNPVMLSNHVNLNENVIGRWLNLSVKDGIIKAEPEFDKDRPIGLEISGQVERDFIKGASMGILPNWDSMERVGDKLILKEWELVEASIVPVPSNRNSIAIYSVDGKILEESEIQTLCLSVSGDKNPKNLNIENMKKIILSIPALMALGITSAQPDGVEASDVEAKVLELSSQVKSLTDKNAQLELAAKTAKEAQEAALKLATTQKVDLAVTQGKIPADKKEAFIQLGLTSPEVLESTLLAIPAKQNFSAGVTTPSGNGSAVVATMEDFQKLSIEAQLSFKNDSPEEYKKLFS